MIALFLIKKKFLITLN